MDERYKEVNLPIQVPKGDYCWDIDNNAICGYLEISGGNPRCSIAISYFLKYDDNGSVLKPDKCEDLK